MTNELKTARSQIQGAFQFTTGSNYLVTNESVLLFRANSKLNSVAQHVLIYNNCNQSHSRWGWEESPELCNFCNVLIKINILA